MSILPCDICGMPASNTCSICGKKVCDKHYDKRTGLCVSCLHGRRIKK